MKKIIFSVLILSGSLSFYAQTKWDLNGNSVSGSNFIGTTNNEALVLKANNTIGLKVKPNGELIFKSLDLNSSTGPNGLVLTDGQGVISRLDFLNNGNKVLYSDGTWGTLPAGSNLWQEGTGNKIYYSGKVGINTSSPNYQLDVNGDARISNNLYVGGGILITRKIEASASLKTDTIQSMSGETKFTSKVILKNQFQVDGTTLFNGTVQANNLYVNGSTTFASPVAMQQGITFDGTNGISFTPANGAIGSVTHIGPIGPGFQPILPPCDFPTQDPWFYFGGRIQLFDATNNIALTMGSDGATANIDASGNNGLKVNYYCHKNTYINTGWDIPNNIDGGTAFLGSKVDMQNSLKIGWSQTGNVDLNTSLEINQSGANANGVKINTFNNGLKAFTISSPNFPTDPYTVFGDGSIRSGSHTINGDAIISSLSGAGAKQVLADVSGKLILAPAGIAGTAWLLGGNISNGNSLGTTDNTDLPIVTNNTEKMRIDAAGNVLINTAGSTSPWYKKTLTVNGDVCLANYDAVNPTSGHANDGYSGLEILGNNKVPSRRGISLESDPEGDFNFYVNSNQRSPNFKFVNGFNGVVSNTNPFLVQIASDGRTDINALTRSNKYLVVNEYSVISNTVISRPAFIVFGNGRTEIHMNGREVAENALEVHDDVNNKINFRVKQNGYVYAREINVMPTNITFPDYVFENSYNLMPLTEVENYINANKHLPNIPSAKEVEENGINMAEMQVKQMEKIEELYLYIIELKKENIELKKRMDSLVK